MSLPSLEQNGVFTHVYPVEDLGITAVLPVTSTTDATVFSTGVGATVVVLSQLSAGSATLNVCVGASGFTPNFGAPTATLAQSGTSMQALVVNTNFTFDDDSGFETLLTLDQRFVAMQEVAGGSGATFSNLAVLVLYELTPGEDWFLGIRSSAGAVMNKANQGDGLGNLSLNPAYANNPYINPNVKQ